MNSISVVVILVGAAVCMGLTVFGGITLLMVGERISDARDPKEKRHHKRVLLALIGGCAANAVLMYGLLPSKWGWGVVFGLMVIGAWGWADGIGDEISAKYGH